MKQMKRKCLALLVLVLTVALFPAASWASVSFTSGEYVKLGYSTVIPPVWEVKELSGATKNLLLGAPLSTSGGYGDTSDWLTSNVREYLNNTYLTAHFSADELATKVLTPYGNTPLYDVTVPEMTYGEMTSNAVAPNMAILPSSAGDSLVWILDVQEIQAIYNGIPDLAWNDAANKAARLAYAASGPYRTRGVDSTDPANIWSIDTDGGFFRNPVTAVPTVVRPVVSPDVSVMLYKRGTGTQTDPYNVTYHWNVIPTASIGVNANTMTLQFPEGISNNGAWPGPDAWKIFDGNGTSYTVTGVSGIENRMTLTVFPSIPKNAKNSNLTLEYSQQYDDPSQGLNNTKGAILRASRLCFAAPHLLLSVSNDANGDDGPGEDENDSDSELQILTDSLQYLVLRQPWSIDLEAEGGTSPYAWSVDNKEGPLPTGLTLQADGAVEGIPASAGASYVTIIVTDSTDKTASKKFTFVVVKSAELTIMTDTLPDAQVGQFYTARVRGCGGTKPYTWEIENLPNWLALDPSSGILTGVPFEPAIHDLIVRLEDDEESVDTKVLRISVEPHDGLLIDTRVLPAALEGKDYSVQLEASGGIPPYFFAPRRGYSLPPGLALNNTGIISGTPTQKGVYDFVIDAIDGNSLQGSAVYTMVILDADALAPGYDDFTVKEYEDEKQIQLSFFLPRNFDDTKILSVEGLTSPDAYIASTSSTVTKEQNGYRVRLALHAAEYALSAGGRDWSALMENLTLDGVTVKFQNASGEEIRFEKALLVKDLQKEREPGDAESGKDSGGGGCNTGWSALLFSLGPVAVLKAKKQK
jgi:hypothetical protein